MLTDVTYEILRHAGVQQAGEEFGHALAGVLPVLYCTVAVGADEEIPELGTGNFFSQEVIPVPRKDEGCSGNPFSGAKVEIQLVAAVGALKLQEYLSAASLPG